MTSALLLWAKSRCCAPPRGDFGPPSVAGSVSRTAAPHHHLLGGNPRPSAPGLSSHPMAADRRRIVARFRRRVQILWAAAALLTVVGAALSLAPASLAAPTPTPTATVAASPTPDGRSPRRRRKPDAGRHRARHAPRRRPRLQRHLNPSPRPAHPRPRLLRPRHRAPARRPHPLPASPPPQRPATPPASSTGAVPLSSALIALAVLLLGILCCCASPAGSRIGRRSRRQLAAQRNRAGQRRTGASGVGRGGADRFGLRRGRGRREACRDRRAYGMADTEIVALPTALLVSSGTGGRLQTRAVTSGRQRLRLHQIEELDDVVGVARAGQIDPRSAHDQIVAIRTRPPPFGPSTQVVGQVLATVGLAVLLGSPWLGSCGRRPRRPDRGPPARRQAVPPRLQVLLTVAASFTVRWWSSCCRAPAWTSTSPPA